MIDQTQQTARSGSTASGLQVTLQPARAYRHIATITLRQGLYTIGAATDADVVLPVGGVQRQHCRIEVDDDVATLTADSRMTWVNDQPVDARDLCDGDRLAIGPVEFTVEIRGLSAEPSAGTQGRPLQAEELDELCATTAVETVESGAETDAADESCGATAAQLAQARQTLARHEAKLAQTEQVVAELEQRREQLQSVVDELLESVAVERDRRDRQDQENRRRREEVARLENEACLWRAALVGRAQDIDQLRGELERRFAALEQVEVEIESQSQELGRTAEELAVQKQDQSEREALLQSRLDELGHSEQVLNERESRLLSRKDALDERAGALSRQNEQLQQQLQELEQQRRDVEAADRAQTGEQARHEHERVQLAEQLRACEEELGMLRAQQADQETAEGEREVQLRERESELEDLSTQLQSQFEALEQRENTLKSAAAELEQGRQQLAERQTALDDLECSIQEERAHIEEATELFAAERQAVSAEHDQQHREREAIADLARQQDELKAEQERQQQQQQREQLESQRRQVDAESQQCERFREELEQDRHALEAAYQDFELRTQRLTAHDDELQIRSAELHHRLADIKSWRSQLRQQTAAGTSGGQQCESGASESAASAADRMRRETEWDQRQAELSNRERELRDRGSELDARQEQVREREMKLDRSQRSTTSRDADVQSAWDEIAESRSQLDRQREEFGAKCEALARERSTLQEDQEAMDVLRRNLQERQRELEDERRRCRDQLGLADAAEQRQEADLRRFETLQDAWRRERATFVEQISALSSQLDEVRNQGTAEDLQVETATECREAASDEVDQFEIEFESAVEENREFEQEIVGADEQVPERIRQLRSEMAASFGYDASASEAHGEIDADAGAADDEAPADSTGAHVRDDAAGLDAGDPDSINRCLDVLSSNNGSSCDSQDECLVDDTELQSEVDSADHQAPDADAPAAEESPNGQPISDEVAAAVDKAVLARQEADLERQKLNSLREVANLSARSALARHASTELKNALLAEGLVTGLCVTGTIVLLASPLWNNSSQVHWGILAAAVSGLMIWRTLRTTARMQTQRSVGKSLNSDQPEAASAQKEGEGTPSSPATPEAAAPDAHESHQVLEATDRAGDLPS